MECPHTGKDDPSHRHSVHHNKADGYQERDGDHNSYFCPPGHPLAFDIGLKIILIKLCIYEPVMELF